LKFCQPYHFALQPTPFNLGDVIGEGTDIYGDGVNIAARLEPLAEPGRICISGTVYEHIDGKLKIDIEDLGLRELKNIARPIHVYRIGCATHSVLPPPEGVTSKPSIAVLPFTNMSGDTGQEHLADGITEDIITELSRFKNLFVIARNSSFTFKGRAVDVKEVGRNLGVRYIVEAASER
jgi:adenylate cyclase